MFLLSFHISFRWAVKCTWPSFSFQMQLMVKYHSRLVPSRCTCINFWPNFRPHAWLRMCLHTNTISDNYNRNKECDLTVQCRSQHSDFIIMLLVTYCLKLRLCDKISQKCSMTWKPVVALLPAENLTEMFNNMETSGAPPASR